MVYGNSLHCTEQLFAKIFTVCGNAAQLLAGEELRALVTADTGTKWPVLITVTRTLWAQCFRFREMCVTGYTSSRSTVTKYNVHSNTYTPLDRRDSCKRRNVELFNRINNRIFSLPRCFIDLPLTRFQQLIFLTRVSSLCYSSPLYSSSSDGISEFLPPVRTCAASSPRLFWMCHDNVT